MLPSTYNMLAKRKTMNVSSPAPDLSQCAFCENPSMRECRSCNSPHCARHGNLLGFCVRCIAKAWASSIIYSLGAVIALPPFLFVGMIYLSVRDSVGILSLCIFPFFSLPMIAILWYWYYFLTKMRDRLAQRREIKLVKKGVA